MMFDVSERADKLVAGYTFYEPYTRAWPPHNHTDQEEIYIFIKGHGAMEVYESPENMTFVQSVNEGVLDPGESTVKACRVKILISRVIWVVATDNPVWRMNESLSESVSLHPT